MMSVSRKENLRLFFIGKAVIRRSIEFISRRYIQAKCIVKIITNGIILKDAYFYS